MKQGQSPRRDPTPLEAAAAALEDEIGRCERLVAESAKFPLHSEKNLQRSARSLQEAAESSERVGRHVKGLLEAITGAGERAQAAMQKIADRAAELRARTGVYQGLEQRRGELHAEVNAIQELVIACAVPDAVPEDREARRELGAKIADVDTRMAAAADRAAALAADAKIADMIDVARDCEELRHLLASLRKKIAPVLERFPPPREP